LVKQPPGLKPRILLASVSAGLKPRSPGLKSGATPRAQSHAGLKPKSCWALGGPTKVCLMQNRVFRRRLGLIAEDLFSSTLRDGIRRRRQDRYPILRSPEENSFWTAPQLAKRSIVVEDPWRIVELRTVPEIGRTAVENTDLTAKVKAQRRAGFVFSVDLNHVAGMQP